jgi:hypothetical protein
MRATMSSVAGDNLLQALKDYPWFTRGTTSEISVTDGVMNIVDFDKHLLLYLCC